MEELRNVIIIIKKYVFFNFVKIGLIRDVEFRIIFEKVRIEDKGIRWI